MLTQLPVLGLFYGGETPVGSRNGHLNDAQAAVFIMVVIMLWASMAVVMTGTPPHAACTVWMGLGLERHNMGLSITRRFGTPALREACAVARGASTTMQCMNLSLDRTHSNDRFVLVLGGANMDISGSTTQPLILSDSNPGRIRCAPGGVARNVAENLARLGNTTRLLTAVGDDLYGSSLLHATHKAGVDVRGSWVLAGEATSTYLSLHGPDGDMAIAVNDMGILETITPARLVPCALWVQQATALVVDCNVSAQALEWLFANHGATPIFVDAVSAFKCQRIRPWLAHVHLLKVNRLEAQALCQFDIHSDADIKHAAQTLHTLGVEQVVLSLGERGVYWSARNGAQGWHGAVPCTVVNATGAGDALMAGLVHAFVDQRDLRAAIPFALGCSALTLASEHANHPGLCVAAVADCMHNAIPHESRATNP